jgi:ribonuclease HI
MTLGITEACSRGIKNLVVEGDSMLVINHLKKKWKVNNKNLKNLYLSIEKTLERFDNISFKHIYRNYNKRADELANIGVTMAP